MPGTVNHVLFFDRGWLRIHDFVDQSQNGVVRRIKGFFPRRQLVANDAKSPHIALMVIPKRRGIPKPK